MDFSSLTGSLLGVLQGDGTLPVRRCFEDIPLDAPEKLFAAVGICGFKTENSFLKGSNTVFSCAVQYRLSLFGKGVGGGELLAAGEAMLTRVLGSSLCLLSVEGGDVSYNTKLSRLQTEFILTLGVNMENGSLSCAQSIRTVTVGGLVFFAESYSFSRKRALTGEATLSDGIFLADGGKEVLSLVLKGFFPDTGAVGKLDALLAAGESLIVSLTGLTLPKMRLCEYGFSGEKNSDFHACTLVFAGAEVMGAE